MIFLVGLSKRKQILVILNQFCSILWLQIIFSGLSPEQENESGLFFYRRKYQACDRHWNHKGQNGECYPEVNMETATSTGAYLELEGKHNKTSNILMI